MFTKFLTLELKSFFRNRSFGEGIAMKILMFFFYINYALLFFGGAFLLYFGAKEENHDPLRIFAGFFIFYWIADLALKYFVQQLPADNIKPFLTMKITKNQVAAYTLAKILASFFTWGFLLFMIPFTILLLMSGKYSSAGVLAVFVAATSMLMINTFLNAIINKKDVVLYSVVAVVIAVAALHYFRIIDVQLFSERLFMFFYNYPFAALIAALASAAIGYYTFRFIRSSLYLDKGLEIKKSVGKTENIAFLNRFGTLGTFINNDIRMIKRSKAARSAFIGGFLFLFYGLLFFNKGYDNVFMKVFMGIFVTGGFNMMFGQRVPAWDSSYYPLMMTQKVPYKDFLKAKWSLFVIATAVSMVLALGYAFISWEYFFTIFAAGLYNLGVNSYMTLLAGAYNKKPIDLNSVSKGFTGGQNNFNMKILLLMIPQMLVPMGVFSIVYYFAGIVPAVVVLGILGLIGFLLRDRMFDLIVKIYKNEKYSTISAFKEIN